jgi:hypothetical protein
VTNLGCVEVSFREIVRTTYLTLQVLRPKSVPANKNTTTADAMRSRSQKALQEYSAKK